MALFYLHNSWVFTAGILGNIISILVYFAPLPTFIRIYKSRSTLEFQCLPYMVALFSSMLWMYYALLKKNAILLVSVNTIGILIETIYVAIFLLYASKEARKHTIKILVCLNVVLFTVIFLGTSLLFKGHYRVLVVGWICVTSAISVFAAPLTIVFQVVKTRSVEFMPLMLSFFLTLSAIIWFAYGLLQRDLCIALPNVFGFILGVLQMLLYGIYKNKKQVEVMEKKVQLLSEHIIIDMVKIGRGSSDQVYPILDSQSITNGSSDDDDNENKDRQTSNYYHNGDNEEKNSSIVHDEKFPMPRLRPTKSEPMYSLISRSKKQSMHPLIYKSRSTLAGAVLTDP